MEYLTHKDCHPKVTVEKIRNILHGVGFFPFEQKWYSPIEDCYSVMLADATIKFSTYGKGISRSYALASSYAEFIERVQGRMHGITHGSHHLFARYGLMKEPSMKVPDEVLVAFDDLENPAKEILADLVDPPKEKIFEMWRREKLTCIPFYNVLNNSITYLPANIFKVIT